MHLMLVEADLWCDVYPSARLWLAACGCRQDVL